MRELLYKCRSQPWQWVSATPSPINLTSHWLHPPHWREAGARGHTAWGVAPRKDPNIEDRNDRVSNEGSVENNALWRGLDSEESRLPHTVTSLTLTGSNRRIEANLESQIHPTVPFGSEMRSPSTIAMTRNQH